MNYETNIRYRRDMINASFRAIIAKDPIKTMKNFEKQYGPIIYDAHTFAYDSIGNCQAVKERDVDQKLSDKYGWKTIDQLVQENFEKLRKELDR